MKDIAKNVAASVSSANDTNRMNGGAPASVGAEAALSGFLVNSLTQYAVFAVSPRGIVISWNAGAENIFGYTESEIVGAPFAIIFTAEDATTGAPESELHAALGGSQTQHDRWHVRKDGTRFWGTNAVAPLYDATGKLLGFTKLVRESTESYLALEALRDSEQQLRLLVESVRDYAIFSIGLDGTIKSWNSGAQKVFGYPQAEIIGRNFAVLYGPDDVFAGIPQGELRKATIHGDTSVERWLMRKDGSRFLASGKLSQLERDAAGELRGFVDVAHDITAHHAAVEDLRRRAQNDELTELPNRRTFYEHVQRAIGSMKRHSAKLFAVLFVDLDRFKAVNDEFGHLVADELLAVTARRLEHCVRSEDIVARIGGDEFAILINGISGVGDATDAAARIGLEMRRPVSIDGLDVRATVSVGIALGSLKYDGPESVLRDADTAMYAAKMEGRARAVVFDASMATGGGLISDLTRDLRQALERDELRVAYQPVLRLSDKSLAGFESLVRWEHPRRGLLLPAEFIPKAEASDLIFGIDRWMLDAACGQLARWHGQGLDAHVHVSVNVSSREFSREEFQADLRDLLAASGLSPGRLRLEITESAVMESSAQAKALLEAVRGFGVQVDVDDFGTGYSPLGSLQHVGVDALKINSAFVAGMASRTGAGLVETVIYLAHKLGLVVIAEGIQTAEQFQRLVELGCDFGQGLLFSPPLDAASAGRFQPSPPSAITEFGERAGPDSCGA